MVDRVEMTGTPEVQNPDHDAKMAEKFEKQEQPAPKENPEENLLAGKYKTTEDLEKAYVELQKKLGQPRSETEGEPEGKPAEDPKAEPADADKAAAEKAGIDTASLEKEFAENGTLTEESYKKLEEAGIPKEMVDGYIQGRQATADLATFKAYETAGGKEAFESMVQWAGQNFSEEQAKAFNDGVMGSVEAVTEAVSNLKAAYVEANGQEPKLLKGDNVPNVGDVYESRAQLTADMSKPEYKRDPAFRKHVEQKLARSNLF